MEKKVQSIVYSIGEQSALLLMAVSKCIVNKKSQAEIAKKYDIPRSRVQWAMYRQERKRKTSEEDPSRSLKLRRNKKKLERVEDKPTPVIEGHDSEDDSDELPDVQL